MRNVLLVILVTQSCMFACATAGDKSVATVGMRKISYRGGVVTFSIPSNWKEESGEDGGGMFYDDSSQSGTLRLNMLSFASSETNRFDVETEARNAASKHNGELTVLRDGNAMVRYDVQAVEDGQRITLRFWNVYSAVNDSHGRVAVFSYTLPSSRFKDEKHVKELEMIDREIRNAQFAKSVGIPQ